MSKVNPQLAVGNERNELKKVETSVLTMRNRVQLLRQQLQKEKQQVKKNKQLTKQVIQKKIEVNRINQYKQKDGTGDRIEVERLKKRNKEMRMSHEKELQDIQKAIYLVKLDDAREVKNISMEHSRRMEQMDRQFLSVQKEKKKKIAEQSQAAKEKYMKYWKQKLMNIYTEQAQTVQNIVQKKQENKKQLHSLQEEQMRLLQEINKHHSQGVETKKQYLAALSLPVKQVAEAMGEKQAIKRYNSSLQEEMPEQRKRNDKSGIKIPQANVNQTKLKIILQQLKKLDRKTINSSR